jgi:hypothetical protein
MKFLNYSFAEDFRHDLLPNDLAGEGCFCAQQIWHADMALTLYLTAELADLHYSEHSNKGED